MLLNNVHFISVSLSYSLEHVFNVRGHSVEDGGLLVGGEVSANFKEFNLLFLSINFFSLVDFDLKVLERLGYGSSLSLDGNDSGFDLDINYILEKILTVAGDFNSFGLDDVFH